MKFLTTKRCLWGVFTFNLLIAAMVWWAGSNVLRTSFEHPIFTEFVNSIPTVKIENKTVVDPLNLNTSRSLAGMPLLYIQTDRDYVGVGAIQDGIYLTRKAVSVLNNSTVQTQLELPENGVISSERVHTFFHRLAIWAPALLGLYYVIRLWIFYLILVGLTALVGLIPVIRKKLTAHIAWRVAAVAMVGVLGIDFVANYFGHGLPVLTYYNYNVPMWLSLALLFFVTMIIQLCVAFVVSTILLILTTRRQTKSVSAETPKKKKKG